MDLSVIIPNYNGENLIKKNLPQVARVFKNFSEKYRKKFEIIVVDDFSQDNSISEIEKIFKEEENQNSLRPRSGRAKLKLIKNSKNYGFSSTVNNGVKNAKGDILILLNTDVIPKGDFLEPLLNHFTDQDVFAVGCLEESVEKDGIILRGRGVGQWRRGFLIHEKGNLDKDNTLWVSGGSGAFKRKIWEKLGGLNTLYNPFYWEDIDISYRALKSGYKIMFEKNSIVKHEHEKGAIKSQYSPFQVKTIAYRNQFIFVWENITDLNLQFLHIVFLPYYFFRAILNRDWAFYFGFFRAFILLPKILESSFAAQKKFVKKDKDVLKNLRE